MTLETHDREIHKLQEDVLRHTHPELPAVVRLEVQMTTVIVALARIEREMVTKEEFAPVKTVVYGLVALIVASVVLALIGLVVVK